MSQTNIVRHQFRPHQKSPDTALIKLARSAIQHIEASHQEPKDKVSIRRAIHTHFSNVSMNSIENKLRNSTSREWSLYPEKYWIYAHKFLEFYEIELEVEPPPNHPSAA
ncbi:hypothetical protein H6775_03890 [Candidatus Nomurabacteria bacterium]|nr:hypothetical protein [Candidatus Nomurabacteria bacterium]